MTSSPCARNSLAECLGAAQADAERFHGHGPVEAWRPAMAWKPWAGGAAGLLVAAVVGSWLWQWGVEPVAPPQRVAAAPAAPRVAQAAAAQPAAVVAAAPPQGQPAAPLPAVLPRVGSVTLPATASATAVPVDPDQWALSPEPFGATAAAMQPPPLEQDGNVPDIPDEYDMTPADDSAPAEMPAE